MRRVSETTVISFRCPLDVARDIDEARIPYVQSRGDWVRQAVLSRLRNEDQQLIIERLDDLHRDLSELRGRPEDGGSEDGDIVFQLQMLPNEFRRLHRNLRKSVYLLLVRLGLTQEEAREEVQRVLGADQS